MFTIIAVGQSPILLDYLDGLDKEKFPVIFFQSFDQALSNMEKYNPRLILITGYETETDLFNFCKKIRESHSLILPILLILDFYSSFDLDKFKNLGVDFLIRPFTREEFYEKINYFLPKKEKENVYEQETDIIDKLKPYIRQEVRSEMHSILKQILEVMEQKNV
ncbi:MAG: hypothetical protein RMI30_06910 [Thermodesulfovibrio sp.]|nr:hypothetical protein [Thermodesulfovibrio sp.]MDW7999160.1 hypothetical protein [Thermodesulfovibrio sp.]